MRSTRSEEDRCRRRSPSACSLALAAVSIGAACAIGIAGAAAWGWWLLLLVVAGAFLVVTYNLELFGGRLHNGFWFAVGWGAFPALTGYAVVAGELAPAAALAAGFAFLLSLVQLVLSKHVRFVRRQVLAVRGEVELRDGSREALDETRLLAAGEPALMLLAAATVVLAAALVAARI